MVCVPVGLAVTVPVIVTVFPTVTVPEMAGREPMVTEELGVSLAKMCACPS